MKMNKDKPSLLDLLSQQSTEKDPFKLFPFPRLIPVDKPSNSELLIKPISHQPNQSESEEEDNIEEDRYGLKNWTSDDIKKWVEMRKKRFPSKDNKKRLEAIKEEELSTIEKKLRIKLSFLKNDDENDRNLKKKARYLKEIATVKKIRKTKGGTIKKIIDEENTKSPIQEKRMVKESKRVERSVKDIIKHLKEKVYQDSDKINSFVNDLNNDKNNYRYIQNTVFTDLVINDVVQERENIMQILRYIHSNNYLQEPKDNVS